MINFSSRQNFFHLQQVRKKYFSLSASIIKVFLLPFLSSYRSDHRNLACIRIHRLSIESSPTDHGIPQRIIGYFDKKCVNKIIRRARKNKNNFRLLLSVSIYKIWYSCHLKETCVSKFYRHLRKLNESARKHYLE